MIDRLLTDPALHYNTQGSKIRKDFPRVWKILAVPSAILLVISLAHLPLGQDSRLLASCDCPSVEERTGLMHPDINLAQWKLT